MLVAHSYLQKMTAVPGEAQAREVAAIVVARGEVQYGAPIHFEMLRLQEWPRDAIPPEAFTSLEEVLGTSAQQPRRARRSMVAGEPVLRSKVSEFGEKVTIADMIDPTKRAMAIRVNDVSGVAGFRHPGRPRRRPPDPAARQRRHDHDDGPPGHRGARHRPARRRGSRQAERRPHRHRRGHARRGAAAGARPAGGHAQPDPAQPRDHREAGPACARRQRADRKPAEEKRGPRRPSPSSAAASDRPKPSAAAEPSPDSNCTIKGRTR